MATIDSSALDNGGKASVARFPGSFLGKDGKIPTKALNLSKSSAEGSVVGTVKLLVLTEKIEGNSTFFVMNEGKIIGSIKIGNPFDMSPSDFDFMSSLHKLEVGSSKNNNFGYRVESYESFDETISMEKQEKLIVDVESFLPSNVLKMKRVMKSTEERIIAAAVLVPGVTDLHNEIYDEDTVRSAAYYFLEHYLSDDDHGIDVMHDGEIVPDAIRLVQSFVLDEEKTYNVEVPAIDDDEHPAKNIETITYPKGTWIMYARVVSDALWNKVKDGTYKSWSIYGLAFVKTLNKILNK
jgi:hypothetical protein